MIIASRSLKLRQGSADFEVPVRIHAPRKNDAEWICDYEIGWPEGARNSYAGSLDAVQALQLALQKIGIELYTSEHHKAGHLRSGNAWNGYGFPVPANAKDLLVGDDAKYF